MWGEWRVLHYQISGGGLGISGVGGNYVLKFSKVNYRVCGRLLDSAEYFSARKSEVIRVLG